MEYENEGGMWGGRPRPRVPLGAAEHAAAHQDRHRGVQEPGEGPGTPGRRRLGGAGGGGRGGGGCSGAGPGAGPGRWVQWGRNGGAMGAQWRGGGLTCCFFAAAADPSAKRGRGWGAGRTPPEPPDPSGQIPTLRSSTWRGGDTPGPAPLLGGPGSGSIFSARAPLCLKPPPRSGSPGPLQPCRPPVPGTHHPPPRC